MKIFDWKRGPPSIVRFAAEREQEQEQELEAKPSSSSMLKRRGKGGQRSSGSGSGRSIHGKPSQSQSRRQNAGRQNTSSARDARDLRGDLSGGGKGFAAPVRILHITWWILYIQWWILYCKWWILHFKLWTLNQASSGRGRGSIFILEIMNSALEPVRFFIENEYLNMAQVHHCCHRINNRARIARISWCLLLIQAGIWVLTGTGVVFYKIEWFYRMKWGFYTNKMIVS